MEDGGSLSLSPLDQPMVAGGMRHKAGGMTIDQFFAPT